LTHGVNCHSGVTTREHLYWHVFSGHIESTLQRFLHSVNALVPVARYLDIYNNKPYNTTMNIEPESSQQSSDLCKGKYQQSTVMLNGVHDSNY